MTFREWVDAKGGMGCRKQDALWRQVQDALGVSYSGQRKWYSGTARPTIENIARLEAHTDGAVTMQDWLHDGR